MDSFVTQFQSYIEAHPPNYGRDEIDSLTAFFSDCYVICNPVDSDEIRQRFQSLEFVSNSLSRKKLRRMLYIIGVLCEEYEKTAFVDGFRVGAQLMVELLEQDSK